MTPDLSEAACRDHPIELFDHNRYPEARYPQSICFGCSITDLCLQIVRPGKSHFDGVAGGAVWRNGYRVRPDNTTREDRLIELRRASA